MTRGNAIAKGVFYFLWLCACLAMGVFIYYNRSYFNTPTVMALYIASFFMTRTVEVYFPTDNNNSNNNNNTLRFT
jgi:hypothetical protein